MYERQAQAPAVASRLAPDHRFTYLFANGFGSLGVSFPPCYYRGEGIFVAEMEKKRKSQNLPDAPLHMDISPEGENAGQGMDKAMKTIILFSDPYPHLAQLAHIAGLALPISNS